MDALLTTKQAAELLGISPRFLEKEKMAGRIAWVGLGRAVRYRPEALEAYVRLRERNGTELQGLPKKAQAAPVGPGFDLAARERAIPSRRSRAQA